MKILVNRRQAVAFAGAAGAAIVLFTAADARSPKLVSVVDAAKLAEPGALKDMAYGNGDAPVTIIEYASLSCSHCAEFTIGTLPKIKEKYIDTGKARLIFREFPFDPRATAAAMLARCAPEVRYFPMLEMFCKQQKQWAYAEDGEAALFQLAKLAGFTQESFRACLTNQQILNDVRATVERGSQDFGVIGTPTFFINGHKYSGMLTFEEMSAIIDTFL